VITDWEGGQGWFASGNLVVGTPGVARELLECVKGGRNPDYWRVILPFWMFTTFPALL
jgi:hypothetical protein